MSFLEDHEPRENRYAVKIPQQVLDDMNQRRGAWYESPAEIAVGLDWGRRKALLMRWVRHTMNARLSQREQQCIELHYLAGLTHRQAGQATGTAASSVCRAIHRGLRKLRSAAAEDPAWRQWWRRRSIAPKPIPESRKSDQTW